MESPRMLPEKFLAAMIAVLPLPGSPLYDGDDQKVMDQALADLDLYKQAGVDSIILENDHDLPYVQPPLDEKGIALMTKICSEARKKFNGPMGIQMLEAASHPTRISRLVIIGEKIPGPVAQIAGELFVISLNRISCVIQCLKGC